MFKKTLQYLARVVFLGSVLSILSFALLSASVSATTIAFQTEGKVTDEGVLSGEVTFDKIAFQKALSQIREQEASDEFIPLNQIEGAKLTFHYVSPYSGVVHTEANLCGKAVYDISGFEDKPLVGGQEPVLVLGNGVPDSVDFSSCVGEKGSLASQISKRDSKVVSSTLDALFGKLSVFDRDLMGNMLSKQIKTIKFTQKSL